MIRHLALPLLLGLAASAQADSSLPPAPLANTALANPAQERAAKALMAEIRCVVCQSQSIAESNADLAGDMRAMIRQRIAAGERPDAIRAWLIQRYGNWISYDPPLSATTITLWLVPILAGMAGLWLLRGRFRRRSAR